MNNVVFFVGSFAFFMLLFVPIIFAIVNKNKKLVFKLIGVEVFFIVIFIYVLITQFLHKM